MSSPRANRLANRREILDEIASTHSRYLKVLKATYNAYYVPLRDTRVLSGGELNTIFRTLEDIKNVESKLNGVLQTSSDDDDVSAGVARLAGEFAVAKAALLEIYVTFTRGHDAAIRCLRAALARSDVSRAIDGIAAGDERVRGEPLEELLTAPLTRIGTVKELLSALLHLCSPSDKGYAALSDAAELYAALTREAVGGGFSYAPNMPSFSSSSSSSQNFPSSSPSRQPPPVPSSSSMNHLLGDASSLPEPSSNTSSSTAAALVSSAMPLPPSTLSAELARADVSTDAVLAAQAEADEVVRRLDAMERETSLKEQELSLAQREVARAEMEARARGGRGGNEGSFSSLPAMDESLKKLQVEEAELLSRMRASEHRAVFEAFLQRKKEIENEENVLTTKLAEHEEALAQVRARLANPPASVLPSDAAKASLYITWKRALAEREELLRQARKRKHELLKDLRARHETQVVLLELERRSAVEGLRGAVDAERSKVDAYKRDLATLDASIESARSAMKTFRQEFEQLRVALLVDRMAKSTQVATLADRRLRLAKEAEAFKEAVESARHRVAAEEGEKWNRKLEAEKEAGEKRVADERRLVDQKIERVRQALQERYEQGFKPILATAEAAYVAELQRVSDLQRELESKEAELRATQEAARSLSAAVVSATGGRNGNSDASTALVDAGVVGGLGSDGKYRDPTTGEVVPAWKLREFEELKAGVSALWEQLDVPPEEVTAFLSEADLLAPFSPAVLEMYQDMYRRLTSPDAALALPPPPAYHQQYQQYQQQQQYSSASTPNNNNGNAAPPSSSVSRARSPAGNNNYYYQQQTQQQPLYNNVSPAALQQHPAALAAAAARQRSVSPSGNTNGRTNNTSLSNGPSARKSSSSASATPSSSTTGFRATNLGSANNRQDDDGAAYLAKLARSSRPPSLGGPGGAAATSASRSGRR